MVASRAFIRVDEHREHYAIDPAVSASHEPVVFRETDGEPFELCFERTVARAQGIEALDHWLATGGKTTALSWS